MPGKEQLPRLVKKPEKPSLDEIDREGITNYYSEGEDLGNRKMTIQREMTGLNALAKELKAVLEKDLVRPTTTVAQAISIVKNRFNELREELDDISIVPLPRKDTK